MEERDARRRLSMLVRVGTVTDLDTERRRARVKFLEEGMTSDFLPVLQHCGAALEIPECGAHRHADEDGETGEAGAHTHEDAALGAWMPRINQQVLCLYRPIDEGDGFILGGVLR